MIKLMRLNSNLKNIKTYYSKRKVKQFHLFQESNEKTFRLKNPKHLTKQKFKMQITTLQMKFKKIYHHQRKRKRSQNVNDQIQMT